MDILLSELIERTKDGLRPFELNPQTIAHYQSTWTALASYFREHDQALFSQPLAEQYLRKAKTKLEAGGIKRWRYEFDRRAVHLLLECFETGQVAGKPYGSRPSVYAKGFTSACRAIISSISEPRAKARAPFKVMGALRGCFWNTWSKRTSKSSPKSGGTRSMRSSRLFQNITSLPVWGPC